MKNPYRRTTRTVRASELSTALRGALASEARPLPEDARALHTRSVRLEKPGLFERLLGSADPDAEHETALVLTEHALHVAVAGAKRGASGWQLPLATLGVADAPSLARIGDLGPSVTLQSPLFGGSEHGLGTYTVYLGPEPDGEELARALRARLAR